MRDPKPAIRETGAEALRAALVVTAQRETTKQSQKPQWYGIMLTFVCNVKFSGVLTRYIDISFLIGTNTVTKNPLMVWTKL